MIIFVFRFGGCIVALVEPRKLTEYIGSLREKYFMPLYGLENVSSHVFVSRPGSGATVYTLK